MSPCQHRRPAEAGFTLIETLAALAVLTVCLGAIGALAGGTLRSSLSLQRHLDDVAAMRSVLAGLPSRSDLPMGATSGTLGGERWSVEAKPYLPDFVDAGTGHAWAVQTLAVRTQSPTGSVLEIDSVRLRRAP